MDVILSVIVFGATMWMMGMYTEYKHKIMSRTVNRIARRFVIYRQVQKLDKRP